ncbi:MAG: hypothetical protein GX946_09390 [Oligosphaeraceae bacterium]|nr:hypothetical protein [Oligosphaeraceae bacterium]
MSFSEIPIGLALIPCDTVIEDRLTGKKSLIGIFGQFSVRKFPYTHPNMCVLVSLTGGSGEHVCELTCSDAGSQKVIFNVKAKIKFKHPHQVLDMVFQLRATEFPCADTYWIKVNVDDMPLMMRPLLVVQRKENK